MTLRQRLLDAAKKASDIHVEAGSKAHLTSGFSRINPIKLAEVAEVAVMAQPLEKLLGAFIRESRAGILLNSERPIGMMHMTCAHELGHFFLGHLTTADEHIDYGDSDSVVEQEANQFAYALLAPRWAVLRAISAKRWSKADLLQPAIAYQLSLRLGMSFTATAWALAKLKILEQAEAAALAVTKPKAIKEAVLPSGHALPRNSDVWILDSYDKDWVIEPRSTDRFVVNLPSHATAGYLWSVEELANEGFTLSPVLVDATNKKRSDPPLVGGSATDQYMLARPDCEPEADDPVRVHLREARPWDAHESAASEIELRLLFETTKTGLSGGTRSRDLQRQ